MLIDTMAMMTTKKNRKNIEFIEQKEVLDGFLLLLLMCPNEKHDTP